MNKAVLVVIILVILGIGAYVVMRPSYGSKSASAMNNTGVPVVSEPTTSTQTGKSTGAVKSFSVTGTEFAFSPDTLTVNKGDTVNVTFTNNGKYPHNFTISELNVMGKTVMAGQSDTVTFTADKAGTFQFFCSVPTHKDRGMVGTITVQ
jgi:nitrosocyanin